MITTNSPGAGSTSVVRQEGGLLDRLLDRTVLPGFSRLGYAARRFSPDHRRVDGQTMVITGATGGLGRSAALTLAGLGAHVVAVGRDIERLERLATDARGLAGVVQVEEADLSLVRDVELLAERILDRHATIDVLVNNVGVLLPRRLTTAEGLETTFATNLLGQFVLTNRLIPRLVESAPARILNVSSGGMYTEPLSVDDLESESGYRGATAYARTKRAQVVLTEMWAAYLGGTGVVAHSMHPGWADTPGISASLPRFRTLMSPILRTPEQGADTIVWLATSEEAGTVSGGFWHDRRIRPTHRLDSTTEPAGERLRLWEALAAAHDRLRQPAREEHP